MLISMKEIVSQLAKEHKRGYSPSKAPDSIWNRSATHRKARGPAFVNPLTGEPEDSKGNEQQASGADIAQRMEFDTDSPRSINDKEPLSMMDIVYDIWDSYDDQDERKRREEEEDRKKLGDISRGR